MKVLIVDDTESDRLLLREILLGAGHEVFEAENGKIALIILRTRLPDVVISDILMPEMDGYRLCAEIRRQSDFCRIPIIIYSATYTSPADEELALHVGADRFLRKPAGIKTLTETLNSIRETSIHGSWPIPPDDADVLKEYSERLVRKLEKKNLELQETTRKLAEAEARIRSLLQHAADMIAVVDAEGLIRFLSPACAHILGQGTEVLMGMVLLDLVHEDDRQRMEGFLHSLQKRATTIANASARFLSPDGQTRWLELTGSRIGGAFGDGSIVINARDATERIALENRLRETQKMDAIGRLAAGIAHDFNNMLSVLRSQIDICRMEDNLPENIRDGLGGLDQCVGQMTDLSRRLLLLARKGNVKPAALDLVRKLRESERLLKVALGDEIELTITVPPDPVSVDADSTMLDQVLINLAVNARDAMKENGRLRLTCDVVEMEEAENTRSLGLEPGSYARLIVADNGCGIESDLIPRMFEPFVTTKEPDKGTGLGLATVFGIIRSHHGVIDVDSRVGSGTTFTILLPLSRSKTAFGPHGGEASMPTRPAGGTETILSVEDDPILARSTRQILEKQGYRVVSAADGVEALDLWFSMEGKVDLIISDIVMPGMGGYQLASRVMKDAPDARIVFVSGYTPDDEAARWGIKLVRGENFLVKPFDAHSLCGLVRNALDTPVNVNHARTGLEEMN